jgi:endonuclease III
MHALVTPKTTSHVCRILGRAYPYTRLGNKRNPLDEYLFILLSLRTHRAGYEAAYQRFKRRFPTWGSAFHAPLAEIAKCITIGGLSGQKARYIRAALQEIREEYGELSLRKLRGMTRGQAMRSLLRLPGIGLKSAKCIMMYSLDYPVLPVDTHVARVAYRLGWTGSDQPARVDPELERLVRPGLRHELHVLFVQHGRSVCRGRKAHCDRCCLAKACARVGVARANNPIAR